MSLTPKQEAFANTVVLNGGDKVAAYREAGYSLNLNPDAMRVQADKLFNNPNINLRIKELQKMADARAVERFNISIEQRLEWLSQVAKAGLSTYVDQSGNERRENLTATNGAVKVMNEMLGINDSESETTQPLEIKFTVSAPKGQIETTNVERD